MKKFSYLLCLIQLAVVCHGSLPKFPASLQELPQFKGKYNGKIVGGVAVGDCSEHSYQVSVQRKATTIMSSLLSHGRDTHFCGGSIINPQWIVLAAHCAQGRTASTLSILAGTHKLDSGGVRRNAAKIIVHESYSSRDVDYDIALIKLDQPLDLSECVKAIPLPAQDEEIPEGTVSYATGWGTTTESGSTSTTLRVVGVPIVTQEVCKASYGETEITTRMICAGLKEGGKDSCQGDSGGPLVADNKLVGITSWGHGCARPEYYGVYTRVPFFVQWVNDRINEE